MSRAAITNQALARRLGVSVKTLRACIARGDVSDAALGEDVRGRTIIVDGELAERELRTALRNRPNANRGQAAAPPDPDDLTSLDFDDATTWPADPRALRMVREHWQARHARRKDQIAAGQLVPLADMQRDAATIARTARDHYLRLPDRLADDLAAESDPGRIHDTMTTAIERILTDFATALEQLGAGAA